MSIDTNAHADDLRVTLFVTDADDNAVSAVEGTRVGLGGTVDTTAGLVTTDDHLECHVANSHTSAVNVTIALYDDDSNLVQTNNGISLGAGDIAGLGVSGTALTSGYRRVLTGSGTDSGRLRTSLFARDGSGDARAPVQQP